ncbi:MAG: hypothetical protein M1840_005513 [Geoglossum simile]|nr:MAG: hypothetical protein M1840_005513 [Geoglossum simile]
MASQQVGNNMEEQVVKVPHINTRMVFPADSHDNAQSQPPPVDRGITTIDQKLNLVWSTIEAVRNGVHYYHNALATCEQALILEKQKRQECAQAYNAIHIQYGEMSNDLDDMAKRNFSLYQELEEARERNRNLQSTIEEYHRRLCIRNDYEMNQTDWDVVEQGIARQQLETRVKELEKEKSDEMKEHQSALINAANRIVVAEQKIDELNKSQDWPLTASPVQITSPSSTGKRQRPCEDEHSVSSQQQGGSKRNRKRRQVVGKAN